MGRADAMDSGVCMVTESMPSQILPDAEDTEEAEDDVGDNLRRCRLSEPLIFAEADSNESRQRFLKLVPFLVRLAVTPVLKEGDCAIVD